MASKQFAVGDRRKFLTQVGGFAVAAGMPFAAGTPVRADRGHGRDDDDHDDHDGNDALEERARDAYRLRVDAARFQRNQPQPSQRSNGDERRYRDQDFIGNFSKTLPHDGFGPRRSRRVQSVAPRNEYCRPRQICRDSSGRPRKTEQPSVRVRVSDRRRRLSPSWRSRAAGAWPAPKKPERWPSCIGWR